MPEKGEGGKELLPELLPTEEGGAVFSFGSSERKRKQGLEVRRVKGDRNWPSCPRFVSTMFAVGVAVVVGEAVTMLFAVH